MTIRPIHVAILGGGNSTHTVRWVNSLVKKGMKVDLITLHPTDRNNPVDKRVKIHQLLVPPPYGYWLNMPQTRNIILQTKPDIVHAIYAGGYGSLLRLINFHPSILSAIGSDVDVPGNQPKWKYEVIKSNLNFPDRITVTDKFLEKQVKKFEVDKIVVRIPFGVDTSVFKLHRKLNNQKIYAGTVKTLEYGYGIDILIKAFAIVSNRHKNVNLVIVGGGSLKPELTRLAEDLKVSRKVSFIGAIPHDNVPAVLNKLSIFVCLSRKEGFGVSVIEASACGLPVIVSNVGGLPETLIDGKTGFIVNKEDPVSAAHAIIKLINDPKLRVKMGRAGREFVIKNYNWDDCVDKMIDLYYKTL